MKRILFILLLLTQTLFSQVETDWRENNYPENGIVNRINRVMSCPTSNTLVTGYPVWTNYYAGWMFKINNISVNNIQINCFEARFQGTSGYMIYTKSGTFIGFETTPAAWTLIGNVASGVVGISTTTSSPIPIMVNVIIPPGSSQSFYLTRTDNLVANRHLYNTGTGTAGTTVYASDINLEITEAEYLDCYFLLQVGVRRPSFQVYYTPIIPLPIKKDTTKHILLTDHHEYIPEIRNVTDLYGIDYGKTIPTDFKGILIVKYEDNSYKKIWRQ